MPITEETMQTRVKQQKRRETEQRTAYVQMSRTVGVVKASQPHFILKLIRCYLLFHNASERTNNDICRAFDSKHLASFEALDNFFPKQRAEISGFFQIP